MKRTTQGFTIVELVVVIVILGILAATALPRFIDLTGDAHSASVQGVGGAYNAGVNLIHAGWLAKGANSTVTSVPLDGGVSIGVTTSGWPENNNGATPDDTLTATECVEIWNAMLTSPPTAATATGSDYQVTLATNVCTYTLQAATGRSIAYDANTGAVTVSVP